MISQLAKNRAFHVAAGITLGGIGALYMQQRFTSSIKLESIDTLQGPKTYVPIPLKSSKSVSHDTHEIVLSLPDDHKLGGDVASCVLFKTEKDGKSVVRPYTPVSSPDTLGEAVFVIKRYPGGAMGEHVFSLAPGQSIEIAGPISKYPLKENQHKQIGLIGGGSGITPLFQILQKIANDPKDNTKVTLFYGSQTPDDILLKKEIDSLVSKKPEQLKVNYFVDKNEHEDDFKGTVGYITPDVLKKELFKPTDDNVHVFVCGPPPLYKAISGTKKSPSDQGDLTGALAELGFNKEQVFKF